MRPQQNTIEVIFGRKGSGKSTLLENLVESRRASGKRRLVIDPLREHGVLGVVQECLENVPQALERFSVVCWLNPTWTAERLDWLLNWVYERGDVFLIIDEVSRFQTVSSIPPGLANIVQYGRHKRIDLLVVARRPTEVNRLITANADSVYLFQTREPRDLEYLQDYVTESARLALPQLAPFHYVKVDSAGVMTSGKTKR